MTRAQAIKLRELIEKAVASLEDEEALGGIELFPHWAVGKAYAVDDRFQYDGKLYKVVQAHTSQADWLPDAVPALYVRVALPDEIPVWVQPTGAHDAYQIGDRVHFPDADSPVYESLIANNAWSPSAYPQGWQLIE